MRSFSGYGFKQLQKREDLPKGPHYVGIIFTTRYEHDSYDGNSSYTVPDVKHYVLKDRAELNNWVEIASNSDCSYTFYYVKELGKVQKKIIIDIDIDTDLDLE